MTETTGKLLLSLGEGQIQEFVLAKQTVRLGRGLLNDVVLSDPEVSRTHAQIEWTGTSFTLVDLGSTNGIRVNGIRVERSELKSGDTITLGHNTLQFVLAAPSVEDPITAINSAAELDKTVALDVFSVPLSETRQARLAVHTRERTWEVPLTAETLSIGRHPDSDIVLDDPGVSRHHARVEAHARSFFIRDLQSTNGTWLRGERIEERRLQDGDTIRIGPATLVFKGGFTTEDLTLMGMPTSALRFAHRPIVVVPGGMGSELWQGTERVWPPDVKTLFTKPEIYRLPEERPLEVGGLVRQVVIIPNLIKQEKYSRLTDYLQEELGYEPGRDMLEFPYDWRQDLRLAARKLAAAIEQWPVNAPVTIIAHSMGCLVTRYYIECLGGKHKVEQTIFLGGPHYGCPKAISFLCLGPDLLPFGMLGERLRAVLATFPGWYQILPLTACVTDQKGRRIKVLEDEGWVPEAQRPFLRAAREFRRELGTRSSVPCISIFGYGLKTVTGLKVERNSEGSWQKAVVVSEPKGDATIPEQSAVVNASEIHPVHQHHGSLYIDNDVKMRLKLALTRSFHSA